MTPNVITQIEQVTPAWLTETLCRDGALSQGTVARVTHTQAGAEVFNSSVYFLKLTYSDDAPVSTPHALVLKLNRDEDGEAEVGFYQLAAPHMARLPMLVHCYDCAYDAASGNSHALLQDISETHMVPVTRTQTLALEGIPSEAHLHAIVDALAQFQAFWWQRPELGRGVATVRWWYTDEAHYKEHQKRRQDEFATFIGSVGSEFPGELRALYEYALERLPVLWDRYIAPRVLTFNQITMSNGDSYFAQYLCSRPIDIDSTLNHSYIIDFQDASANFPAYDLVYLFATFWTREQRREREERLFHRYLDALHRHGVTNYTWENLWLDYRLMVALMIFDPVWNQVTGSSKSYWWPKLQCLTAAYKELHCSELFV